MSNLACFYVDYIKWIIIFLKKIIIWIVPFRKMSNCSSIVQTSITYQIQAFFNSIFQIISCKQILLNIFPIFQDIFSLVLQCWILKIGNIGQTAKQILNFSFFGRLSCILPVLFLRPSGS